VAINFMGNEDARVLATPQMILYMERTCRETVLPLLDPGHDTVGTHVNVSHLAATPIGMLVTFTCEVTGVTDRRIQFRVEARDERDKIGEGTHERAIVNVARFATKLAEKKAAAPPA
jgi:fluoroacetyl-CoA thioesterase